jgi:hypothetical protein
LALAGNKINNHNSIEVLKKIGWFISKKKKRLWKPNYSGKNHIFSKKRCSHRKKRAQKNNKKKCAHTEKKGHKKIIKINKSKK